VPGIDIHRDQEVLRRVRQLRPHKIVVLDCRCHSFDDVEQTLCRVIPAMTLPKAHAHAWEIHTTGASVVATAPLERAEHFGTLLSRRPSAARGRSSAGVTRGYCERRRKMGQVSG
jgi:ATP-dependent Clp protease adapter protein ClpS